MIEVTGQTKKNEQTQTEYLQTESRVVGPLILPLEVVTSSSGLSCQFARETFGFTSTETIKAA